MGGEENEGFAGPAGPTRKGCSLRLSLSPLKKGWIPVEFQPIDTPAQPDMFLSDPTHLPALLI